MSTRAIVAVAVGALVAATVLTNSRHFAPLDQVALAPPLPPAVPAPILAPIPVPVLVPVLPAPVAAVEPQRGKATVSGPAQAKPPARPSQKHRPRKQEAKQEARKVVAEPRPISRLKPPPPPPALKVKAWGQRLLGHPVDRMSVR